MNLKKLWLNTLALPKTLWFNFHYFPFAVACKLPVFVSHRVWLMELAGKVEIESKDIKTRMIKIGFGGVAIFDQQRSRSIWQVSGKVVFKGAADIGHGSKLSVAGDLVIGDDFILSAESAIVARERVEIGNNALMSWDILIMDTDFHAIYDQQGQVINHNQAIYIGNDVWIGCRAMILKGSKLADGSIIAAGTTITPASASADKAIIGGYPPRVLKENITWDKAVM